MTETVKLEEYIKVDLLQQLIEMGFSRDMAIRALWKTGNSDVDVAIDWLGIHGENSLEEPLPETIEIRKPTQVEEKVKLTPEEAQAAALRLQKKLRDERIAREAQEAKDAERQRIASTKALMEQQAILDEQKRKRDLMERERLKREDEAHRAELAERLRLDYIERFGCEPPVASTQTVPTKPKEKILWCLNQIGKKHSAEVSRGCLNTLRMYLSNIESNSAEKKFHKIRLGNKVFAERVYPCPDALELLRAVGFQESDEVLEIKTSVADGYLCGQAVKYIDVILNQL
jgi:hypothetical protein